GDAAVHELVPGHLRQLVLPSARQVGVQVRQVLDGGERSVAAFEALDDPQGAVLILLGPRLVVGAAQDEGGGVGRGHLLEVLRQEEMRLDLGDEVVGGGDDALAASGGGVHTAVVCGRRRPAHRSSDSGMAARACATLPETCAWAYPVSR